MATFSVKKAALDDIAVRIKSNQARVTNGLDSLATAVSDLTSLQSQYTAIVSEIDADLAANPDDDAYKVMKSEKDKLVAEFLALKAVATSKSSAAQGA